MNGDSQHTGLRNRGVKKKKKTVRHTRIKVDPKNEYNKLKNNAQFTLHMRGSACSSTSLTSAFVSAPAILILKRDDVVVFQREREREEG